jgi:hypothetical protein
MAFMFLILAPVWAAGAPVPAPSSPAVASQQEQNKAVALRVHSQVVSSQLLAGKEKAWDRSLKQHRLRAIFPRS